MTDSVPVPDPLNPEAKAANRSANFGCLVIAIALFILIFSFGLGGYSAYRLNQFREDLIRQHLENVVIPHIHISQVTPAQAMEELKEALVQVDPWFKGVQFKLYTERDLKDASRPVSVGLEKPLSLILENVTAYEVLRFYENLCEGNVQIIDGSVNLLPRHETLEPRKLLSIKQVEPDFWKTAPGIDPAKPAEFWDVKPLLEAQGLPFLPRTHARYYADQKRLEINNLKANNEKISAWLQEKGLIPLVKAD